MGKLDRETRSLWETKDQLPTVPELSALFAHLEQRILAIRNMEQSARQYNRQPQPIGDKFIRQPQLKPQEQRNSIINDRKSLRKDNDGTAAVQCPMCANGVRHFLWKCDAFRALSGAQKLDHIKRWKLCEVCLVATHSAAECTKGKCPNCNKERHNSLICPHPKVKHVHHVRGGKRRHDREYK